MIADAALKEFDRVLPSGSVIQDPDLLERYSHDESEAPPSMPDAVIRVTTAEHAAQVMRIATKHRVPVTPRSGGTGRTGGSIPLEGGIVLAFETMNRIKGIEKEDLLAFVEPGVITGTLHQTVENVGLFYPPDPNSLGSCAIGGNVAENAGGPRAFKYGVTREYVLGLQVVTADGTLLQLGRKTVKGVTGYDLTALLVGSEGTLGLITEVTLKLLPLPQAVRTFMALLPDEDSVERATRALLVRNIIPRCAELLDEQTLQVIRPHTSIPILESARAMIIFELDGDEAWVEHELSRVGDAMLEARALEVLVARHSGEREKLWSARREMSYAMRKQARFKLAEDVVVPRTQIAALCRFVPTIGKKHGLRTATYGHVGDGNLHVNFLWDDPGQKSAVDLATKELFVEVIRLGGTLTGEHGVGILKRPYLKLEQSDELMALQKRIKDVFDPQHILNPGKIFEPATRPSHGAC